MKTNRGLVEYAEKMVGQPYWYGTFGQKATITLYLSKKRQYPSNYVDNDYSKQYGKRVHDCVGLIKGYLWSETPESAPKYKADQDKSAAGMYRASNERGSIETVPNKVGILVYKGKSTKNIHHVGILDGEGNVIEAKGHKWGVIKTPFDSTEWLFWSRCPYTVDADDIPFPDGVKTVDDIAKEVIAGKWGNGIARKKALTDAGWNYAEVQKAVNRLLKK